ncbi:MAG: hypothetical protein CV087_13105 [Candidatus Brocadia sp. WS118]|nr:MAG: hypothetical protein CV087_13105 [Candidatus Brocadia sp. WS118]
MIEFVRVLYHRGLKEIMVLNGNTTAVKLPFLVNKLITNQGVPFILKQFTLITPQISLRHRRSAGFVLLATARAVVD